MAATRTTDYAVRALVALALEGESGKVKRASALALASGTPGKFMEQVMRWLRQGGFVVSRRGSGGGYELARPAEKIRMSEVVARREGREDAVGEAWGKLQRDAASAASKVLAAETLGRLAERVRAKLNAKGRTTEYQI